MNHKDLKVGHFYHIPKIIGNRKFFRLMEAYGETPSHIEFVIDRPSKLHYAGHILSLEKGDQIIGKEITEEQYKRGRILEELR